MMKLLTKKSTLHMSKWAKTHLEQCRISKKNFLGMILQTTLEKQRKRPERRSSCND